MQARKQWRRVTIRTGPSCCHYLATTPVLVDLSEEPALCLSPVHTEGNIGRTVLWLGQPVCACSYHQILSTGCVVQQELTRGTSSVTHSHRRKEMSGAYTLNS